MKRTSGKFEMMVLNQIDNANFYCFFRDQGDGTKHKDVGKHDGREDQGPMIFLLSFFIIFNTFFSKKFHISK